MTEYLTSVAMAFGPAAVLFFALAVIAKGRRAWQWPISLRKSVATNVLLSQSNKLVYALCVAALVFAPAAFRELSIPQVPASFWAQVPLVLAIPFALVARDFVDYWTHRVLHEVEALWAIHAIHHSDTHMNWTTTYRVHFFEGLFMMLAHFVMIGFLGLGAVTILAVELIVRLHNNYVHSELPWHHGPLETFIASPSFHSWHHAEEPSVYGKNLANIFPFWDVLFGTYHAGRFYDGPKGVTGVPVESPLALWAYPFRHWAKMFARRKAPPALPTADAA